MGIKHDAFGDILNNVANMKPDYRIAILKELKSEGFPDAMRKWQAALQEGYLGMIDSLGFSGHDKEQVEYIRVRFQTESGLMMAAAKLVEDWSESKDKELYPASYGEDAKPEAAEPVA